LPELEPDERRKGAHIDPWLGSDVGVRRKEVDDLPVEIHRLRRTQPELECAVVLDVEHASIRLDLPATRQDRSPGSALRAGPYLAG
jgi:hypothetical protein